MADPRAKATAAFSDGAAQLQQAGSRLTALTTLFDQQFGALVGRLGALPPAATFSPFGGGALVAAVASLTGAAGDVASPVGPLPTVPPLVGSLLTRNRRSSKTPVAPGSDLIGTLVAGGISQILGVGGIGGLAAAGAGGAASTEGPGATLPFDVGSLDVLLQAAEKRAGKAPAAAVRVPSAAQLPVMGVRGAALIAEAVADLIGDIGGKLIGRQAAKPSAAPGGPGTPMPAWAIALRQVEAMAAATVGSVTRARPAAPERPAQRAAVAGAGVAAARAPSRLVAGLGAAAAAAARPGEATAPPPASTPPAGNDTACEEDLVAAINRLLVDQAWMRGVDLR